MSKLIPFIKKAWVRISYRDRSINYRFKQFKWRFLMDFIQIRNCISGVVIVSDIKVIIVNHYRWRCPFVIWCWLVCTSVAVVYKVTRCISANICKRHKFLCKGSIRRIPSKSDNILGISVKLELCSSIVLDWRSLLWFPSN